VKNPCLLLQTPSIALLWWFRWPNEDSLTLDSHFVSGDRVGRWLARGRTCSQVEAAAVQGALNFVASQNALIEVAQRMGAQAVDGQEVITHPGQDQFLPAGVDQEHVAVSELIHAGNDLKPFRHGVLRYSGAAAYAQDLAGNERSII